MACHPGTPAPSRPRAEARVGRDRPLGVSAGDLTVGFFLPEVLR